MLMLLSPAKTLVDGPAEAGLPATRPRLLDQAAALAQVARGLSPADLRALMSISEPLAALNHARFQAWSATEDPSASRQAALLFAGDVYRGLDAPSLSAEDLEWAQGRLAILSGLYGVLRPLDLARPYRLEMGTRLATPRGADLYAWWGQRIAEVLRADLRPGDAVVNLASQEYFGAVDAAALGARVITPVFRDVKGGKARTLGYFAKHARGAMARWAIQHRVDDVEGLKACDADGYRYAPEHSTADRWEFRRPQPPPPR